MECGQECGVFVLIWAWTLLQDPLHSLPHLPSRGSSLADDTEGQARAELQVEGI